jgi:hypothetical protein
MKAVFLEYEFIFDPAETWSSLYELEGSLTKYLDSIGMEGEIMETVEGQSNGRRIIFVKKKPEMPLPTAPVKKETPKQSIKRIRKELKEK